MSLATLSELNFLEDKVRLIVGPEFLLVNSWKLHPDRVIKLIVSKDVVSSTFLIFIFLLP